MPESVSLEFIPLTKPFDKVAGSVCAMLNSKGGTILTGVKDQGDISDKVRESDAEKLRVFLHENITPRVLFTVTVDDTTKGKVISIDVPEGRDRPYVFNGKIYIRSGARTHVADGNAIREMVMRQSAETERWERRIASGLTPDDLDINLIRETVKRAQKARGFYFKEPDDIQSVLSQLSLLRFGQLDNAADVTFGRQVALRHPQTRLRAVCYRTDRADDFIDEQLFEGPAFTLLESAMAFLKRHINIESQFNIGTLTRESRPQYPFYSLREGLVNALVHRDYSSFSGGITLSVYPNRVEILNSGHLPKGVTIADLSLAKPSSVLVNPDICHIFYLHDLMERVGRGTYNIVMECRELGIISPVWQSLQSSVKLTFYVANKLTNASINLNARQKELLDALGKNETIKIKEFHERFGHDITERQARRDLKSMVDAGLLEQTGRGPATGYRLIKRKS